ncbi:Hypothetical protein, putative [Bodo saltans]|uniref:Uncharacterized protein n=1 Tax=Bodo saltans TaxID=75058 RepID=A0A0S4JEB9_BODSA|nr:Hypothetical protein, putative [Bodo saltans]|eukprot:CUG89825.1 Hypothetical protein, putative [Bodo saltans]
MSEAMFTNAIVSLFEVAEVNSIGGVPLDVGVEALMLVNPDVEPQQAHAIATQLDSRGRQVLSKDFSSSKILFFVVVDNIESTFFPFSSSKILFFVVVDNIESTFFSAEPFFGL